MGHLHDRMKEDLVLAGKAESTQKKYLYNCRFFAAYHMRSPEEMGREEVRDFLLYLLRERGVADGTYTNYVCALKFLYKVTLRRPEVMEAIPWRPHKRKKPPVLTVDEVRRILGAAPSIFFSALFKTAYAAGLRGKEVCSLRVSDIDSRSTLIRVRNGKGGKPRTTMLSPALLRELRTYWRAVRPPGPWLFPTRIGGTRRFADKPITRHTASTVFRQTRQRVGIDKPVALHALRHAFATHLLESGVDVHVIQTLLGHSRVGTTTQYTRVRTDLIRKTPSPLDLMEQQRP